jgi:hypothetical protein
MRAFKTALTKILNNIKSKIVGYPTVLWSGRGCHVIQPINCNVDLDNVKEYAHLLPSHDKEVNKLFLQFAAKYLSDDKKDSCNRTSPKSCLLRIPGSLNSKCKEEGKGPEVKIIQEWDGFRPDIKLLLGSFYSYLVAEKLKDDQRREKYSTNGFTAANGQIGVTYWIEKLLETPLNDYRQIARDLIIIPYLIVRRGITNTDEIEAIVMGWADKCNELEPLNPTYREFEKDMRYRINVVRRKMIPPMSFDTLQKENPELAKMLRGYGNNSSRCNTALLSSTCPNTITTTSKTRHKGLRKIQEHRSSYVVIRV